MPGSIPSLHLVGDSSSPRADAARAAAKVVQLRGLIRHSSNIAAATASSNEGPELLVLIDGTPEDLKIALSALDERRLPRWAVIPALEEDMGNTGSSAEAWEPAAVARSMRFAVSFLALRRENIRLSGDLHTVARRLTHDLRTPLNSISTANEALAGLSTASEPSTSLHQAISAAVDETGTLLDRFATGLLSNVRPLATQSVEMEEIVWRAREKLDAQIRLARATIHAPEKWPVVMGVPSSLELVWTNLLSNSVQHGGPTPRIELGWKWSDAHAYFWLRDNGPGVAVAKRGQLFHPFDRLNEFNAPRGYGLSLVHRIIEGHGGTSGYTPDPGSGGTFYFTLPGHQ